MMSAGGTALTGSGRAFARHRKALPGRGSRTSSTEEFLGAVTPAFAVISDGFENSYGQPHATVIELLEQHHAAILRTDKEGLITIHSDGRRLAVETYQGSLRGR
jgi:beta-lactamase superfamily II metal-dependent hydrolase